MVLELRSYVSAATRAGWNTKYRARLSRLSDKPLTNKNISGTKCFRSGTIAVDSGDPPDAEIAHVAALSPDRGRADRQPEADPADGGGGGLDAVLHDPLAGDRGGAGVPALRLPDVLGLPAAQWSAAVPLLGLPARLQPDIGYPVRLPQAGNPRLPGGGRDLLRRGKRQGGPGAVARS